MWFTVCKVSQGCQRQETSQIQHSVLLLGEVTYKQMFYLAGFEILNLCAASASQGDLSMSYKRHFVHKCRVCWQKKEMQLLEIQLFTYRCVISLKRHCWCYCRLKTKPHPDRANLGFACQPFHQITKPGTSGYCVLRALSGNARGKVLWFPPPHPSPSGEVCCFQRLRF